MIDVEFRRVPDAVDPPVGGGGWTKHDAQKVAWFLEQLARALRGDVGEMEAYIAALQAEPPSQGKHDLLVEVALPPIYAERDR